MSSGFVALWRAGFDGVAIESVPSPLVVVVVFSLEVVMLGGVCSCLRRRLRDFGGELGQPLPGDTVSIGAPELAYKQRA